MADEKEHVGLSGRTIDRATLALVLAGCGWVLAWPLRRHGVLLGFAEDDFYYYLKAAQNFAGGRGATFDGTTITNGFQPLYFLLLAAVSRVTQDLRAVFKVLWVADVLSAGVIFVCARRVFAWRTRNAYVANVLAVWVLLFSLRTIVLQMEVTLALPLGFVFLAAACVPAERYTPARCAGLGLLAAAVTLARLDGAILIACFVGGMLAVGEYRTAFTRKNIASFLAASLPLPLGYFLFNLIHFQQLLPISGSAKQLRHGWMPSRAMLGSFHTTHLAVVGLSVACVVAGWLVRRRMRPAEKVFCIGCFGAPLVFYTVELFLSDWPLWNWYLYMLRFALAACFLVIEVLWAEKMLQGRWKVLQGSGIRVLPPLLYCCSLLYLFRSGYKPNPIMVDIQEAALKLDSFSQSHPGRYAMGDRAGMFGYTTDSPVLQAEGLMMDRRYLDQIRREEDLKTVLLGYGVKYYVAFTEMKNEQPGPCFHAREPTVAGKSALRMRSDLCQPPVYQFRGIDGTYRVFLLSPAG